jgi:putative flippase GtrA
LAAWLSRQSEAASEATTRFVRPQADGQPPASAGGPVTVFLRYILFAVVSTIANLGTQELVVRTAPVAELALSILAGTAVGFAVKYVLDKKWIFYDAYTTRANEARKIGLYGLFSVATTLIFWGFEVAFWTIWRTDLAKYSGAVLGLAIGYAAKYGLDRAFVFKDRRA